MRAFVFGALPVGEMPLCPQAGDRVIACDRGLQTVRQWGLTPDEVIGDFDSLGFVPPEATTVLPVRKDDTDVGYALKTLRQSGCREVVVYGCLGGLPDHTLANVQLAAAFSQNGGKALFIGEKTAFCCVSNGGLTIRGGEGRVSVLAVTPAQGVCISGLSYECRDAAFSPTVPLGVSNELIGKTACISVKKGTLAVFFEPDVIKNDRLSWKI